MQNKDKGMFALVLAGSTVLVIGLFVAVGWNNRILQNNTARIAAQFLDDQKSLMDSRNDQVERVGTDVSGRPIEWTEFNSMRDAQLNKEFSFKYPSTWIQKGSSDSDSSSAIPFFEKSKYSQNCDERGRGVMVCGETGQIAVVMISNPAFKPAKVEYEAESRKSVTVGGYSATKLSGKIKTAAGRIGKVGEQETRVIVENVNGLRFEIAMLTEDSSDIAVFDELIKSVEFKF